ncbi:heat shock protein DnaJ domain protein [Halothece sp. PCC 7418]|uniref:J domain-containing protein n=1 Tax=Halothece sp. (strain PCC 7418) TaxID=65093 RepID=UPI0002A05C32|nr:J domain-containing protein [Halothece sp. PCC 7418]AFZ44633.1 heat shock protein DnaJ domain protein [Halothece sp. PCC 7418]
MELVECYRLLELSPNAGIEEIKASYRRLARRYHPDVNPHNREQAHTQFIRVTEAYKYLLERVSQGGSPTDFSHQDSASSVKTEVKHQTKATSKPPSELDQKVKWDAYKKLQELLKTQKFARATTLVESLSKRFPNDSEVRQWQAITYQQRGRQLVNQGQFELARKFLKKALSTDPHNRSLWYEVDRDFQRIEPLL